MPGARLHLSLLHCFLLPSAHLLARSDSGLLCPPSAILFLNPRTVDALAGHPAEGQCHTEGLSDPLLSQALALKYLSQTAGKRLSLSAPRSNLLCAHRVPAQHRVLSSLDPLYGVVRRYLDVVQQNPFPTGEPDGGAESPGATWGTPRSLLAPPGGALPGWLCRLCCDCCALLCGGASNRSVLLLLPAPPALWGAHQGRPPLPHLAAEPPHFLPLPHYRHSTVSEGQRRGGGVWGLGMCVMDGGERRRRMSCSLWMGCGN
uniref:Uncharacterized protein n=1 Tax=Chelonoidis abingdonii TaxID=106734 RepID=A0A8C0GKX8_CHEAB